MKYFLLSLFLLLGFVQVTHAQSAILYFAPATGTFTQGQTVSVDVMVNTSGEFANAVGAYFTYPIDKLDFVSIAENEAAFDLFVPEDPSPGTVRTNAGSFAPGFTGVHRVATVRFLAKSAGSATLAFTSDSVVLRNSDNQNVFNRFSSGQTTITITSSSVPPSTPGATPLPTTTVAPPPPISSPSSEVTVSNITENSAVISWKTETPSISKIVYNGKTLFDGAVTADHRIILSDLTADTPYTFQVIGQADEGQFRTQAINSQDQRKVQEEMRDLFNRVPGGLITVLILFVLVVGSVLFLVIRIRR